MHALQSVIAFVLVVVAPAVVSPVFGQVQRNVEAAYVVVPGQTTSSGTPSRTQRNVEAAYVVVPGQVVNLPFSAPPGNYPGVDYWCIAAPLNHGDAGLSERVSGEECPEELTVRPTPLLPPVTASGVIDATCHDSPNTDCRLISFPISWLWYGAEETIPERHDVAAVVYHTLHFHILPDPVEQGGGACLSGAAGISTRALFIANCVIVGTAVGFTADVFNAISTCIREIGLENCTEEEMIKRMKIKQLKDWMDARGTRLLCDYLKLRIGNICGSRRARDDILRAVSSTPGLPTGFGFDVELRIASSDPSVLDAEFVGNEGDIQFIPLRDSGQVILTLWAVSTDTGQPLPVALQFPIVLGDPTARFSDDPLRPGVTPIRAVHFTELRLRIDALRAGAGLARFPWTDPVLRTGTTPVKRAHLVELRTALAAAYAAAGRAEPAWTDVAPVSGTTPIRAAHLMELRAAVVALE